MNACEFFGVAVIGGGPAGLAAALAASRAGASVLLIEREAQLGGILKQCIHDGFGLVRFSQKLSGPEYASRFVREVASSGIAVAASTFVTRAERRDGRLLLTLTGTSGLRTVSVHALVLATGCRERTARQIGVHGRHCAGVFTAGTAQYYVNVMGQLPTRRCVILGSGDIGLIMARRLTLEGAQVVAVYEAKPVPSGLPRNVAQCLEDFGIPLHTSRTVTRIFGEPRVTGVETAAVDAAMRPIPGTEERVDCDALILSVGLIPENELAESLDVPLDPRTHGPIVDQRCMTLTEGVFVCGNALHVSDLVDYVSENGETAGAAAAAYALDQRSRVKVLAGRAFLYTVPQCIDVSECLSPVVLYFRCAEERGKTLLTVLVNGAEVYRKTYPQLRPPEMQRVELDLSHCELSRGSTIELQLTEAT